MKEDCMEALRSCTAWHAAYAIQRESLERFHTLCVESLGSACSVRPLDPRMLSMEANLFSSLFIMATASVGLSDEKVRFHALVNQCLRALVTGCDNILDDEYKEVVRLDLPGNGTRFRSVLQIMTGDAVLARLMTEGVAAGHLDVASATRLSQAVFAVLIPSGIQEHEEESRLRAEIPTAQEMIEDVHYRKTGLLFQAPLRLVAHTGGAEEARVAPVAEALSQFGGACQILDDLMDVAEDLALRRFNLVASLAYHGDDLAERKVVRGLIGQATVTDAEAVTAASALRKATEACSTLAHAHFAEAYAKLAATMPLFGRRSAEALGALVQRAIMKERFVLPLGRVS